MQTRAKVAGAMCSSGRRAICLVAVRRVLLLGGFLLAGFAISACWSAAANAVEDQPAEVPATHVGPLDSVAMVAETVKTVAATNGVVDGVVDDVRRSIPTAAPTLSSTVHLVDTAVLNAVTEVVADMVDDVAEVFGGTAVDPTAVLDVVTGTDILSDAPARGVIALPVAPGGFGHLLTETAPAAVTPDARGAGAAVATGPAGPVPAKAGIAVASRGGDAPNKVPGHFPMAPFAVAGSGGAASSAGSSGGPAGGAVLPGQVWRADSLIATGTAAERGYPLRQRANNPPVAPA